MQLRTKCPNCEKVLKCGAERSGTMARCPACRHKFRVETLVSGGAVAADSQPSVEAMRTIDHEASRSGDRSQSSGSPSSGSQSSPSQASRSVSRGGKQRAKVAAQPSLGRFGPYDLKAVLGKGGFGVVYRGWDDSLGRQVAIKIPRFDMGEDRKVRRFRQEARAAAKLQHPGIVGVIAEGVEAGKPYIVSEFVDGETMSARIERQKAPHRQAAQ